MNYEQNIEAYLLIHRKKSTSEKAKFKSFQCIRLNRTQYSVPIALKKKTHCFIMGTARVVHLH